MEQGSELQRLEKFVEKILARFSALKEEKIKLEQEVFERDLVIEELRENISSKVTERTEISERVNRIVGQIEEWELSLEKGDKNVESNDAENLEAKEFHNEKDILEQISEDEESRVQHDLFSMTSSNEE